MYTSNTQKIPFKFLKKHKRPPFIALAIPRALWAAPGGAAWHASNQLSRAINHKPFQCSVGRNSPQRRRSAARVEQGDLFKFYAHWRSLISAHLSWRVQASDSFYSPALNIWHFSEVSERTQKYQKSVPVPCAQLGKEGTFVLTHYVWLAGYFKILPRLVILYQVVLSLRKSDITV